MNIFYKIYARIFQTVFKLAIPLLPYKNPEIISKIEDIVKVLKSNNKNNSLIVTDKGIINAGLLNYLINALDNNKISYSLYSEVVSNPTSNIVYEGSKIYKNNNCDSLIAFGGGSSMDTAKAIGAVLVKPKKKLSDLEGILHVGKKIPLLIAIPTTCGTGSETTLAAVITDSETRHKYAINDFPLIPSYAVLDGKLLLNLPSHLIATTGLDALTHAIEAFIGRSATKATKADSLDAIKLIFENILDAYNNHTQESLNNMLLASYKAGRAFTKSYVGYVHAIAHSLGGKYNIPHGYANAVILPYVLKEYDKAIYKKIAIIYDFINLGDKNISNEEKFKIFLNKLLELEEKLSIDRTINCINDTDIDEMVAYALKEANPLYPVPVLWDKNKMKKMYYIIQGETHE